VSGQVWRPGVLQRGSSVGAFSTVVRLVAPVALWLTMVGSVSASHSLPADPHYWDCNNDGSADDGCVKGYKAGTGWTSNHNDDFDWAFAEWSSETDFDPQSHTSGQAVYIDDRAIPCLPPSYAPDGHWPDTAVLACVKVTKTWRLDSYYDIGSSKTYMNYLVPWWIQLYGPPSPGTFSFTGVLTHELGHWVRLVDLAPCPVGPTMCGSVTASQSFALASLENDDINAANSVYP
jgi:hypothetical protein